MAERKSVVEQAVYRSTPPTRDLVRAEGVVAVAANLQAAVDLAEAARQSVAYVALVVQAVAQADRAVILVVLAA